VPVRMKVVGAFSCFVFLFGVDVGTMYAACAKMASAIAAFGFFGHCWPETRPPDPYIQASLTVNQESESKSEDSKIITGVGLSD